MAGRQEKVLTRVEQRQRKRNIVLALLLLLMVLSLGGAIFFTRIETVYFEGNSQYTDEELLAILYPDTLDRILLYDYLKSLLGEESSIPFVEQIEKNYISLHEVEIIVYEKSIVGCIAYMGSYMYFDKDGIIVESSSEWLDGVPIIQGLSFTRIVLYQELPVSNATIFEEILNLTQLIALNELPVEKIYFDSSRNATLYLADKTGEDGTVLSLSGVIVKLGDSSDMEEKMAELKSQLSYLSGLSGTLHLESYERNAISPSYVFEKATTAETVAESEE